MTELISKDGVIEVLQQFAEDEKPTDEMSKQFQQYQRGRHLAFLQAVDEINALPSVETTAQYDDFHEEIKRLTEVVEYYQDQNDALKRINDSQVETIRTYAQIVTMMDAEINKPRGELI